MREKTAEILRGEQMVLTGFEPVSHADAAARIAYFEWQRDRVRRLGCCGHGEVWVSLMGRVCCKHTRDPCPRQMLGLIVELWQSINGGGNEHRIIKSRRWGRANRARGK